MLLVFGVAATIWTGGKVLGLQRNARLPLIGLLFVAVLGVQLFLPAGHPLREQTGGEPAFWLILAGFCGVIWAYWAILQRLRVRAQGTPEKSASALGKTMCEAELERYARHIILRELGGAGQQNLRQSRVLVIGAGGLGAPALQYLAAAGVGTIGVIDDDIVENGNLQRQVIHGDADIGTPKVFSAQKAMEAQNPFVKVKPYHRRLTREIAASLFADYDLVLDGSDNFDTRYLANDTAMTAGIPLVSGALSQWEGQLSVFDPARGTPCYRCIFPEPPAPGLAPSCAQAGVLGPLPGVVGSMMAVEAVKLLADTGAPLRGEMLIYDALWSETRKIVLRKRSDCPRCGTQEDGKDG